MPPKKADKKDSQKLAVKVNKDDNPKKRKLD